MTDMTPDTSWPEAVEAVRHAVYSDQKARYGDEITAGPFQPVWYHIARTALAAAEPFIAAREATAKQEGQREGWDEGYGDCLIFHQSHGLQGTETNPHPEPDQEDRP